MSYRRIHPKGHPPGNDLTAKAALPPLRTIYTPTELVWWITPSALPRVPWCTAQPRPPSGKWMGEGAKSTPCRTVWDN
ncbi:hypothetical protein ColKHC_04191 [Colletotrichum higginsianum]|nr:hypothetical protein ColKHC_04191 [Colletotrichum higginsianum]